MPQRHRLVPGQPDRAPGVDVVERAGEGDDPDLHRDCSSTCTSKSSITGLDSSFSAISCELREPLLGDLAVHLELEALALADVADPLEAEPGQRTVHGLALRVEDLGLEHDVDDDTGHGDSWFARPEGRSAGGRVQSTRRGTQPPNVSPVSRS